LGELPDSLASQPDEQAARREQLTVLREAMEADLTARQREVFVAIALNEVPIDVLALQLGSNRNAIYKNLFDARRKLRASLAPGGHPLTGHESRKWQTFVRSTSCCAPRKAIQGATPAADHGPVCGNRAPG
jgi:hypothetical protein